MLFRLQIFALEIRKTCIQSAKQIKRNARFFSRDLPNPAHDPEHEPEHDPAHDPEHEYYGLNVHLFSRY